MGNTFRAATGRRLMERSMTIAMAVVITTPRVDPRRGGRTAPSAEGGWLQIGRSFQLSLEGDGRVRPRPPAGVRPVLRGSLR